MAQRSPSIYGLMAIRGPQRAPAATCAPTGGYEDGRALALPIEELTRRSIAHPASPYRAARGLCGCIGGYALQYRALKPSSPAQHRQQATTAGRCSFRSPSSAPSSSPRCRPSLRTGVEWSPMPYHPVLTCLGLRWPAETASSCASLVNAKFELEKTLRFSRPRPLEYRLLRARPVAIACDGRGAHRPRFTRLPPGHARSAEMWPKAAFFADNNAASRRCGTVARRVAGRSGALYRQGERRGCHHLPGQSPGSRRVDRSASISAVRVPRPDRGQ